jgi:pSer/pThr/pTyr-binding forkhead associated (FHA) protein
MTHARIDLDGERATITDISDEGGLTVNGEAVQQAELHPGDHIVLGKHTLSFSRLEEEEETERVSANISHSVSNGWLQFMNGPKLGRTLRLDRALVKLGKSGSQSAMISGRNDGYYISHLEGEKPTRVGSVDIGHESHKLHDGDTIQIGDIKMMFFTESKQE